MAGVPMVLEQCGDYCGYEGNGNFRSSTFSRQRKQECDRNGLKIRLKASVVGFHGEGS